MLNTDEAFTHVSFIKRYPTLLEDRYKHIIHDNPLRVTLGCVFPRRVPSIIFRAATLFNDRNDFKTNCRVRYLTLFYKITPNDSNWFVLIYIAPIGPLGYYQSPFALWSERRESHPLGTLAFGFTDRCVYFSTLLSDIRVAIYVLMGNHSTLQLIIAPVV